MNRLALSSVVLAVLVPACGGSPPLAARPVAPAVAANAVGDAGAPAAASPTCPATIDVPALLARHGKAYGTEDAVAGSLPRTLAGTVTMEGKDGAFELVLSKTAHRSASAISGIFSASGIDGDGPWDLALTGVMVRLHKDEDLGPRFDEWLARRRYLSEKGPQDVPTCTADATGARATVRFAVPTLGMPELMFDLESGALLAATHLSADGTRATTFWASWSTADANGVRWPSDWSERPEVGSVARVRVKTNEPGAACPSRAPHWPAGADCLAPFPSTFTATFPGDAPVRVPMAYYLGELAVRVKIGGREVWALLDSGAELTALDSTTPAGAAFVPSLETEGAAATQKVRMGLGEVSALGIGKLALAHVPVVSVPIPALDAYGDKRPDVIVGYPLFLAAAVRVDYAKGELVVAKSAASLHSKAAVAVTVGLLSGKPVAKTTIDGKDALVELDTGNSGAYRLNKAWTDASGIPGDRPTKHLRGVFGAGTEESTVSMVRIAKTQLGPITWDDRVAACGESPPAGWLAGIVGNRVFSRCAAMVWDLPARTVWFEPPCDRASPEQLAGWRLDRKPDPRRPDRPWVVVGLVDSGAAAKAGVALGDRLLDVDGKPATQAMAFEGATMRPAGTKVPVTVDREGAKAQVVLELTPAP